MAATVAAASRPDLSSAPPCRTALSLLLHPMAGRIAEPGRVGFPIQARDVGAWRRMASPAGVRGVRRRAAAPPHSAGGGAACADRASVRDDPALDEQVAEIARTTGAKATAAARRHRGHPR
ncbi:hypothetical protein K2Z84_21180 [Candidatus Binatia bacterium]|nr:hypothetical protein [Candidatus Binatia bacterium]